jgi:hypothetical protein
MRGLYWIAVILISSLAPLRADTALEAVKLLPPGQAARIVRIEGREGSPDPDRWYILTQDPSADNGVHEFVVSNGAIVASRSLSQFADSLTPADILANLPEFDSDKAAKIADDYATANGAVISTMSYDLRKAGTDAPSAWTISCIDYQGNKIGVLVLGAALGNVISHEGFVIEPTPSPSPAPEETSPHYINDAGDGTPRHSRHSPTPKKSPNAVSKTLDNVGRTLEKFLPF